MNNMDRSRVWQQIKVDESHNRFVWHPSELLDNVIRLLALASEYKNVDLQGSPYEIGDDTWAYNYK